MHSPSVPSATLSHESIDEEVPMDIDDSPASPREEEVDAELSAEIAECLKYSAESEPSPSMRAAACPDVRVLQVVLRLGLDGVQYEVDVEYHNKDPDARREHHHSRRDDLGPNAWRAYRNSSVGISSPLFVAIRAGLLDNVKILLEAGADPNALPLYLMEDYAALFLRFRPSISYYSGYLGWHAPTRDDFLDRMTLPQISSISTEEVEDRFWDGMAPFWCEEGFTEADFFPHGEAIPSLVEAARCAGGNVEIFEELLNEGADASFWMSPQSFVPYPPTASRMSVSSPIHAVLQSHDIAMLRYLLNAGFDPNTMPLSNPTRCITPLMATIVYSDPFDSEAFFVLSRCRNMNFELRTRVYRVHILHFAVATLDIEAIQHVSTEIPLRNAGTTALGHTLLHIACLPANSWDVQQKSEMIFQSIHETRNLHARNDRPDQDSYERRGANLPPLKICDSSTERERANQMEIVLYLWENGIIDIEKEDVHGNTALHYLAGCKVINDSLLTWLRNQPGVEDLWQSTLNRYGATPQDLYRSGIGALIDIACEAQCPERMTVRRSRSGKV